MIPTHVFQDGLITDSQHLSLESKYVADLASGKRSTAPKEVNIEQTLIQLRELYKGFKSGWISPDTFKGSMRTTFENFNGFKGLKLAAVACKAGVTEDVFTVSIR